MPAGVNCLVVALRRPVTTAVVYVRARWRPMWRCGSRDDKQLPGEALKHSDAFRWSELATMGLPPIVLAILRQDVDLVRLMVKKGADLSVRDRSGSTILMWAAFNETGDATLVEELLRLGANPAATNKAGETALTWALRRGETPVTAALRVAARYPGELRAALLEYRDRRFDRNPDVRRIAGVRLGSRRSCTREIQTRRR